MGTADTTVSYVPPGSRREATLVFDTDPHAPDVDFTVAVTGYTPL